MNIKDLREAMGLTVSQVAEELGVPRQDVADSEETGSTYLLQPFIAAFPINPAIMKDPDMDPFLDSYVQNEVRDRAAEWREENGLSLERMAAALGMTPEQLKETEDSGRITKTLGIKIEKNVGMNRKWLMYGDGRVRGTSVLKQEKPEKEKKHGRFSSSESEAEAVRKTAPNREAGERIRAARKAAGMSREELAKIMDLSVSRIAQMESGYVRDRKADEMIAKICPEPTAKEIGLRLRQARKDAGMKLKDAARLAGIATGTLAAMECGHISSARADEIIQLIHSTPKQGRTENGLSREAGLRIRDERKNAGMTQKELAVILRMPESAVSRMELGNVTEKRAEEIIRRIQGEPRHTTGTSPKIRKTTRVLLGRQIRDARERAGLSQKAAGELVGLPQSRISLMEKGNVDESAARELLRAIEAAASDGETAGYEN